MSNLKDFIGFGGVHDVGFTDQDIVPIEVSDIPATHWDKTIHSLLILLSSKKPKILSTDELRLQVESLDPFIYNTWPFYDRWAIAITKILINKNIINQKDLDNILYNNIKIYNDNDIYLNNTIIKVKSYDSNIKWFKPHIRCPGYLFNLKGFIVKFLGYYDNPSFLAYNSLSIKQPLYKVRFYLKDVISTRYYNSTNNNIDSNDTIDADIYHEWLEVINDDNNINSNDNNNASSIGIDHLHNHNHNIENDCCGDNHDNLHENHNHNQDHQSSNHTHDHNHDKSDSIEQDHLSSNHNHNHTHDNRDTIELNALESERLDGPGKIVGEAMIKLLIQNNIISLSQITATINKLDSLKEDLLGAHLVAKAWIDNDFKNRLLNNPSKAAAELGINVTNPNAPTDLVIVENTDTIHNIIVCTLCSCYPVSLLGLSPSWYKSINYRARVVREPRKVLEEFGTILPDTIKTIRVHDSTADMRYLVLPCKPKNISSSITEEELRKLVTRDSMIGVTIL